MSIGAATPHITSPSLLSTLDDLYLDIIDWQQFQDMNLFWYVLTYLSSRLFRSEESVKNDNPGAA